MVSLLKYLYTLSNTVLFFFTTKINGLDIESNRILELIRVVLLKSLIVEVNATAVRLGSFRPTPIKLLRPTLRSKSDVLSPINPSSTRACVCFLSFSIVPVKRTITL